MTQFYRSYLFAYLTILGMALGCLGLLLLHSITGGHWGKTIRRILQAGADTLPALAVFFLPILMGLRSIYPWADPATFIESAVALHKHLYFHPLFFIGRGCLYFLSWIVLSRRQHKTASGSAVGLLIYVLTVSFASFDWAMSLEPQWSSSIYGTMLMVGDVLSALALAIVVLEWQSRIKRKPIEEDVAHDLGNLLLAFVMLWAYMAFSQYLIIWSANLPEEIGWYLARQRGGWQIVGTVLILLQFMLPFLLLLGRERKRRLARLARVAAFILVLRVVDVFWLIAPDFSPGHFSVHGLDVFVMILIGGGWLFGLNRQLKVQERA